MFVCTAMYCGPKSVHITDIHTPTLRNAVHNARLNSTIAAAGDSGNDSNDYEADVAVSTVIPVGGVGTCIGFSYCLVLNIVVIIIINILCI